MKLRPRARRAIDDSRRLSLSLIGLRRSGAVTARLHDLGHRVTATRHRLRHLRDAPERPPHPRTLRSAPPPDQGGHATRPRRGRGGNPGEGATAPPGHEGRTPPPRTGARPAGGARWRDVWPAAPLTVCEGRARIGWSARRLSAHDDAPARTAHVARLGRAGINACPRPLWSCWIVALRVGPPALLRTPLARLSVDALTRFHAQYRAVRPRV